MNIARRQFFLNSIAFIATSAAIFAILALVSVQGPAAAQTGDSAGSLVVLGADKKPKAVCPLKQTQVKAEISGFISRVNVTQEFENPFKEKIEAVYTFPLPQNAAVDDMTMTVGERVVRGRILRREEAQAVYDAAKNNGQVASLLDQERPNIFTQSVANILPGEQVKITISYVETLKYEAGVYEFVFPMVVGPRYVPGSATGSTGNGFAPDTDKVPDGSRITPQFAHPSTRSGHDITLDISIDAGVPLDALNSKSHAVNVERSQPQRAHVQLKGGAAIPNHDFVLRYEVGGKRIQDALLTHRATSGGFFSLILQPPDRVTSEDVTPKELVFVLDTSGSMNGFPIEKAKETMKLALDNLYPADTFNLITFAGDTRVLFPEPVPATRANLRKAQQFLDGASGQGGGTEMMKAILTALAPSDSQKHLRIVCFMTDGYVGNDMEIVSEIQRHPNARVFAFGIGNSVNRFLLDKMAEHGRGEVEYVALTDDGSAAAKRFHERVRNPLLTDISIEWNGLPVADVYPVRVPDLFDAKPVVLTGRYSGSGKGTLRLKGKMSGQDFVREIAVDFPESQPQHDVLPALWARQRIEDLMGQDYGGAQSGAMKSELQETITNLGLEYRLMTQFTSFVAVEEMIVTEGGKSRRVEVPIEVPEGVNDAALERDAVIGEKFGTPVAQTVNAEMSYAKSTMTRRAVRPRPQASPTSAGSGGGSGGGRGSGGGMGSVSLNRSVDMNAASAPLSAEEEKQRKIAARIHPSIAAVIARLKSSEVPKAGEARFVRDGKAEIQVWLIDKTPENLAKLKELGFEILLDSRTSKVVIGRLTIEKLANLAELDFVRYVSPQLARN